MDKNVVFKNKNSPPFDRLF
jgi:hypothetical protein